MSNHGRQVLVKVVCGPRERDMWLDPGWTVRHACEIAGRQLGLVPGLTCLRWRDSGKPLGVGTLASEGVLDGGVLEAYYKGEGQ